ncbi:hypothetical protein ASPZODRAFT_135177 [Penicilliopsis zonata CBS 506.65]|uniref:Uncharacterized protein n=1 Tax=Penicilliopsis zonata CBS 506.65 TaxID=1073090 RepID=A0A1L9SB72_9EURO|nr:hypothetical protein ASPZODRAFT_135177 [Penicilliopsis zonata CBS 506.65]OJJ44367.1 hypothetical protein ASPZODRAFT_135177 [Penicilliopsis zonata CBS 506.65]
MTFRGYEYQVLRGCKMEIYLSTGAVASCGPTGLGVRLGAATILEPTPEPKLGSNAWLPELPKVRSRSGL